MVIIFVQIIIAMMMIKRMIMKMTMTVLDFGHI